MAGDGGGALFAVVWGLGATGFGWVVATNFRGAADRFLRLSQRSVPFGRSGPPPVGVGFLRATAAVFALAGPVFLVFGLVGVAKEGVVPGRFPDVPLPVDLAMFACAAAGLWSMWRRSGMLRREWHPGVALVRAACVVATVAVIGLPVTMTIGYVGVMMADWLLGGAAILTVLVAGRADRDESADHSAGSGVADA
ncbi:hypothetical protein N566_10695 [Streptomycetaceae bacterium MP113-05]|nr:hypothetical protein N566_10695 [Streptomycetaceae bacterium MP113-05]